MICLTDPPVIADDGSTRWWPPRILDPAWLREHAGEFDVLHVHFGFESFSPEHLREVVDVAHELGKGVVVTVHDLRNPHIKDPAAQLSRLDALVPAADTVITLTQGAADAIQALNKQVRTRLHLSSLYSSEEGSKLSILPCVLASEGAHSQVLER